MMSRAAGSALMPFSSIPATALNCAKSPFRLYVSAVSGITHSPLAYTTPSSLIGVFAVVWSFSLPSAGRGSSLASSGFSFGASTCGCRSDRYARLPLS